MSLFLVTFFLLYGGMHFYILMKARGAFSLGPLVLVPLVIFMIAMVLAPVFARISERAGLEWCALPIAHVGYLWFGFLFLFVCSTLFLDVVRLLFYLAGLATGGGLSRIAAARTIPFCLAASCALLVTCYGMVEAEQIRTGRLAIKTDKLTKKTGAVRIVQISDVHLGLMVRESRLRRIMDQVRQADPDILVSTGDLLDGQTDSISRLIPLMEELKPRLGKFAITGNHEFYAGLANFIDFAEKTGFTVLRGEGRSVGGVLNVAGVDDRAGIPLHLYRDVPEKELLSGLDRRLFTLLLKHQPLVDRKAVGLFDLQLSGHTHDGQIFPFKYVVRLFFPYTAGHFDLGRGSHLYVNRGTGTWGPPIRFLAPPEITVIDLEPA